MSFIMKKVNSKYFYRFGGDSKMTHTIEMSVYVIINLHHHLREFTLIEDPSCYSICSILSSKIKIDSVIFLDFKIWSVLSPIFTDFYGILADFKPSIRSSPQAKRHHPALFSSTLPLVYRVIIIKRKFSLI